MSNPTTLKQGGDRVIVVGAGPVGLMAAQRLLGAGVETVVLEAAPKLTRDLRATTFHPPTLDMLAEDGLAGPLIDAGLVCCEWQIRMHPSGESVIFDMDAIAGDTAHPYRLQAEQFNLTGLLADRLKALGGTLHFAAKVVALDQDDSHVTVTTADGAEYRGRYAIGADGGQGAIRKCLEIGMPGSTYPQTNLLATTRFPFHDVLQGLSNVTYAWAPQGNFALLRLPDLWRCSLYPPQHLEAEETMTPEIVRPLMAAITPDAADADLIDLRPYRVHRRLAEKFSSGRVFLAGDAAHLNPPSGGMGMNGGIHDAVCLAGLMTAVIKGDDASILQRYEAERRPIVAADIIAAADANRSRMTESDPERRLKSFRELQNIASDRTSMRDYLLKSSMITGLRRAHELREAM